MAYQETRPNWTQITNKVQFNWTMNSRVLVPHHASAKSPTYKLDFSRILNPSRKQSYSTLTAKKKKSWRTELTTTSCNNQSKRSRDPLPTEEGISPCQVGSRPHASAGEGFDARIKEGGVNRSPWGGARAQLDKQGRRARIPPEEEGGVGLYLAAGPGKGNGKSEVRGRLGELAGRRPKGYLF